MEATALTRRILGRPAATMSMQPVPTLWAQARTGKKAGTRGYFEEVGGGVVIIR